MQSIRGIKWPLVAVTTAAILLAAPLWSVAWPAMPDYPAHLASFYLIGGGVSRYYSVAWDFLPNLASEAIVPLLARLMPLETAVRLFLTATVALWVLGPAAIQRALFGKIGPAALLSAFFAYNANFMWGFFNYTFAVGLSFFVFAAWIATDGRRTIPQQIGFIVAVTLIYFCHMLALAVLLLAIGCFELSGLIAERPLRVRKVVARLLPIVLLCLPAAFAFLVFKPAAAGSAHIEFDLLDTMLDRLEAAIQFGFDKPATILTGALTVLFAAGVATQRIAVHPRVRITLVVLLMCAVLAPEWALGGWGVHMRLPAVLGALAFGSIEWKLPQRAVAAGAAACLLLIGVEAVALAQSWGTYNTQFAEFRAHAADIKANGRLLTVLDGDSLGWASDQPYWHIAEFAVLDRGVFTPLMFATAGQHVVHVRAPLDRIAASNAQQGSPPDIDELDDLATGRSNVDKDIGNGFPYLMFFQCHFDQALVIHGVGPHSRVPAMLRLREEHTFYTLYDIAPDALCAKQ